MTNRTPTLDQLLTFKELAALMRVHWQTVRRWAREDKLRVVRIGHTVRITRHEAERLMTGR